MENGTCISLSNCPCIYHGTAFPVGSKIEQECSNWYVKACVFHFSRTTVHSWFNTVTQILNNSYCLCFTV